MDPASQKLADGLKALARRDATAQLTLAGDGSRRVIVVRSHADATATRRPSRCDAVIPYGLFRDAQDAGWLVLANGQGTGDAQGTGDGLIWTLSPLARQAMRRIKSASGSPTSATARVPKSPTAPHISQRDTPIHDPAESPLAWLRRHRDKHGRPLISAMQLEAGDRLRRDFWLAEMSPRVTVNWDGIGGGGSGGVSRHGSALGVEVRDNVVAAQQRVRRALAEVGPLSAGLLIDVCGHLLGVEEVERRRGWPVRSGKVALQMALSDLARHYRLPGCDSEQSKISARLRHWGSDGYRPNLDGDQT